MVKFDKNSVIKAKYYQSNCAKEKKNNSQS